MVFTVTRDARLVVAGKLVVCYGGKIWVMLTVIKGESADCSVLLSENLSYVTVKKSLLPVYYGGKQ